MNDLISTIEMRRARRALAEKKIPAEVIGRIMTAATYAPSCFNNQAWRFLVATQAQALQKIHPALTAGNYWAKKAPCIVVVATRPDLDHQAGDGRDYALFDCGLAAGYLMLQAVAEGLYAHPMAGYDSQKIKSAFGIPTDYIVINLIALGYPGESHHLSDKHQKAEVADRERKPQTEVICYERWCLSESTRTS